MVLCAPVSTSAHSQVMVTGALYQPEVAGGIDCSESCGGEVSILMGPALTCALLPAESVQRPVTNWLKPCCETVIGSVLLATASPLAGVQLKVTVTGWLVNVPGTY